MLRESFLLFVLFVAYSMAQPEQITVAFATDTGMSVAWWTEKSAASVVKFGLLNNSLDKTATGSATTYSNLGYFHKVVINGLTPDTTYYYVCGDGGSQVSTVHKFVTAATAGVKRPFSAVVVGDMGLTNSADTLKSMISVVNKNDFWIHIGDLSYADDWYIRGDTYEGAWKKFQELIEPISAEKAYMVLPGNHECTCTEATPFTCPAHQKNFTSYLTRFRMPFKESGAVNNMWYSFDYGQVHFIQINTETDFPDSPEGPGTYLGGGGFGDQMTWVEQDLKKAIGNREKVPWIIVSGHRPLYSSGGETKSVIKAFEPLFKKYNVDIYFAGHVHWYERMYPISDGKVTQKDYNQPTSPVYIISGSGGNVEGLTPGGSKKDYVAHLNNVDYGYGVLDVYNSTTVRWSFYTAQNNALDDQIYITKNH